jgi:hypothetical protein
VFETAATTHLDLISFIKVIPDFRVRRVIRIPAWYQLLVMVLGSSASARACGI